MPKLPEKTRLINGVMSPRSTEKFLNEFHDFGLDNGWFPKKPKSVKDKNLGKWVRKRKTISDKKLKDEMSNWIRNYTNLEKTLKQWVGVPLDERSASKTLSLFHITAHADCSGKSTALGEMAKSMGYNVEYNHVGIEGIDLSQLAPRQIKLLNETLASIHAYVTIDGKQFDPSLGLLYPKHKGVTETREERAAQLWTDHALYLVRKHELKRAMRANGHALKLVPDSPNVLLSQGIILTALNEFEKGLAKHDKVLEANPDFAPAWFNRGITLVGMERLPDALKSFKKAKNILPVDHPIQGYIKLLSKNLKKARTSDEFYKYLHKDQHKLKFKLD